MYSIVTLEIWYRTGVQLYEIKPENTTPVAARGRVT